MAFDISLYGGKGSAGFVLACDLSFIHTLLFSKCVIKNEVRRVDQAYLLIFMNRYYSITK